MSPLVSLQVCVCVCVCALVPTDIWGHLWVFNRPSADVGEVGTSPQKKPVHHLSNVFFSMYVRYEKIEEICVYGSRIVG